MTSVGSPLSWTLFISLILVLLALDLGVFHRKVHRIGFREATVWSIVWIIVAMLFNLLVYWWYGSKPAVEFFTGYIIERALSIDNIFVFLIVFSYFSVPAAFQHRVLFWGILGAVVMRALFILLGTVLITTFHWIIFIFGAFLVYTGFKIMVQDEIEVHPENNLLLRFFRRIVPIIPEYHGARFTVVRDGKRYFTPMLLVLLVIESTDVVFAVDSIPAIFAITKDPFIAFTSNIFAILGLRAMYFLLADIVHRFAYLKYGLGLVLVFVGLKMLISDFYKIDSGISLVVVTVILAASMIYSWMRPPKQGSGFGGQGSGNRES
ncbi:MAG: TerC family protein [Acidobacteriota bacterium]